MTATDVNADVRARFEDRWPGAKEWRHPQEDRYILIDYQLRWQGYHAAHAALAGEVRELVEALEELRYARTDKAERMADAALAKHTHQEKNDVLP